MGERRERVGEPGDVFSGAAEIVDDDHRALSISETQKLGLHRII
ncbi:MAG: hypothetical protein ABI454_11420 [Sphingomicrobium sp.]